MTKPLLLLLIAAIPLSAAYLQCVVVDWDTGRPLSRSTVTVEGIQGGQSLSRNSLRTDRAGSAMVGPLADGAYIITVSRPAFATQQYGQTGWNRPGLPLMVQGDRPIGIEVRLRHLPSISGTVWDENQVGIPGAPVVIYTATRPAKLVTKAVTDDRGIYRAGELLPGAYVVRNAAKQFDDSLSIVPTFYPDGNSLAQARAVEIDLDRSAQDINFSPAQGRLFPITGRVNASSSRASGTGVVELISDAGRTNTGVDQSGAFSFEGIAPGTYELFTQNQREAGWTRLLIDHDYLGVRLDAASLSAARIFVADQQSSRVDNTSASLFARRKDLDVDGPVIPVVDGRTALAPGNWELAVSAATTFYPLAVLPYQQAVSTLGLPSRWLESLHGRRLSHNQGDPLHASCRPARARRVFGEQPGAASTGVSRNPRDEPRRASTSSYDADRPEWHLPFCRPASRPLPCGQLIRRRPDQPRFHRSSASKKCFAQRGFRRITGSGDPDPVK